MPNEVRIPDVEILIGAAGSDVALFCFYGRADIHQGYDVVAAIGSKNERPAVRQVLLDALKALDTADWYTVDELHEGTATQTDEPPF